MEYHEQITFPNHVPERTGNMFFRCGFSSCEFRGREYLDFFVHTTNEHFCKNCNVYCTTLQEHQCNLIQRGGGEGYDDEFYVENTRTHNDAMLSFIHEYKSEIVADIGVAFTTAEDPTQKLIVHMLGKYDSLMSKFVVVAIMSRDITFQNGFTYKRLARIHFPGSWTDIFNQDDTRNFVLDSSSEISNLITEFTQNGSGWILQSLESLNIMLGELRLFQDAKPGNYIPFPLSARQGYTNIKDTKGQCFALSLVACLHWDQVSTANKSMQKGKKAPWRASTWQPFVKSYDFSMIGSHLSIFKNLDAFENVNNVAVNILSHRGEDVIMVRKSRRVCEKVAHLFLIYKGDCPKTAKETHLCPITNLSKFMAKLTAGKHKTIMCPTCFRRFASDKRLEDHRKICMKSNDPEVQPPKAGSIIKFNRWYMRLPVPFICTYNIQACSKPGNANKGCTLEPLSYCITVIRNFSDRSELRKTVYYDGENVMKHFWNTVGEISREILTEIRNTYVKIKMTDEQKRIHDEKKVCDICSRAFDTPINSTSGPPAKRPKIVQKAADHDFMDYQSPGSESNLRYTCCIGCNNSLRYKSECLFLNSGENSYENFFVLKGLDSQSLRAKDINIIARNASDFVQLKVCMKNHVLKPIKTAETSDRFMCGYRYPRARFISASRFFDGDIESMVTDLLSEGQDNLQLILQGLHTLYHERDPSELLDYALNVKRVPLQALNGMESLSDGIPAKDLFFDQVNSVEFAQEDYDLLTTACDSLGIDTLGKLVKVHSTMHCLLLASIWSKFSRETFQTYGLCPSTVPTIHTYAYQAMLHYTGVKIELPTDKEAVEMLNQPARGGLLTANVRAVFANHEGLPDHNGHSEENKIIYSADVNSMYSYIMSEYKMPVGDYEFVDVDHLANLNLNCKEQMDWFDDSNLGFLVEVDLEYPDRTQTETQQLPFAPSRCKVQMTDLSSDQQEAIKEEEMRGRRVSLRDRLLLTCHDKQRYLCDIRILSYYMSQGLELVKIHRALSFRTSDFLASFMKLNQEKRNSTTSPFMKKVWKSMSNGIWGMMARRSDSDVNVTVCDNKEKALKALASPYFADFYHVSNEMSLIFKKKKTARLDKPRAIGHCISDCSKLFFYDTFYTLGGFFPTNQLCTLDTDGFIAVASGLRLVQFFDVLYKKKWMFDFRALENDCMLFQRHPNLRGFNAGTPGKLKIENYMIGSLAVIRPKQHSVEYFDELGNKCQNAKCSGVKRSTLAGVSHEDYLRTAINSEQYVVNENGIRCDGENMHLMTTMKKAFVNINVCRVFPNNNDINKSYPIGYKGEM